jgi:hypothetical protein
MRTRIDGFGLCAGMLLALLGPGTVRPALAWDPSTTHSGLTERALYASRFHATLAQQLGRPLGGFEPLRLDPSALDPDLARTLRDRLAQLDSAGGCRPDQDGVASAMTWARAGAVLEKTPPERGRHHFFEPGKRSGLDDGPGLSGETHAVRLTFDNGATVRDIATGQAFALDGMPALDWLWSPRNDLGLPVFFDNWQRAASATKPSERESALVRALLALGGTLAVLEDMGQPAFVRNDFRGEFLGKEDGSPFERFVADRYGSVALPAPAKPVVRPTLESFFVAADGKGLAQRTQASFFSAGSLPNEVRYVAGQDAQQLPEAANESLRFPKPAVGVLDLRKTGVTRHWKNQGVRVLAYRRDDDSVAFFLDDAVYADCARRWLPEIEAYAAGWVNHLLRAKLEVSLVDQAASVVLSGVGETLDPQSELHVLVEDDNGMRKEIAFSRLSLGKAGPFVVPPGARKIVAYAIGRDRGGRFVAIGEQRVP